MSEQDEKLTPNDNICPKCGKLNRIAIVNKGHIIGERFKNMLKSAKYRIVTKGDTFACQYCGEKIKTE